MSLRSLRFALALVAPLAFTLGCDDENESYRESSSSLYLAEDAYASYTAGTTATFRARHTFHWYRYDCESSGCGGSDLCPSEVVPLESRLEVTCGDPSCSVETERVGVGEFDVRVTASRPVTLTLTATDANGTSATTSTTIYFRAAARMEIAWPDVESPWMDRYASLPGAVHEACVTVLDEHDMPLAIESDEITLVADGLTTESAVPRHDSSYGYASTRCDRFTTDAVGEHVVTYRFGTITRTFKVSVVDPAQVAHVELVEPRQTSSGISTEDAFLYAEPVRPLAEYCSSQRRVAVRFETADGDVGIADALDALTVSPADLLEIRRVPSSPFATFQATGPEGAGPVTVRVGDATTELMVSARIDCAPQ